MLGREWSCFHNEGLFIMYCVCARYKTKDLVIYYPTYHALEENLQYSETLSRQTLPGAHTRKKKSKKGQKGRLPTGPSAESKLLPPTHKPFRGRNRTTDVRAPPPSISLLDRHGNHDYWHNSLLITHTTCRHLSLTHTPALRDTFGSFKRSKYANGIQCLKIRID